jgi:hypothetical protein
MTSAFGDQKEPMMTSINNVGEGWHPLIQELEEKLNKIDPDFELQQVKEKFGGLRYYAQCSKGGINFHKLIAEAEEKSVTICEECGKPAVTLSYKGWLKTLCEEHRAERLARMESL